MINYFTYDYPQPNDDLPFSVNLDAAACPWQPAHRLVRIGLKGREMPNEKRPASNLVFLLDVSGSMEPANGCRWSSRRCGCWSRSWARTTASRSWSTPALRVWPCRPRPATTRNRSSRALENLQAGGSTNGAQGIELAYQTAAEHFIKGGVNRVILATDGDFNVGDDRAKAISSG